MRDKRRRIFDAATALFDERGFDAVTTQEISERADIAVGTLFRYAASKNELLVLVYNDRLRRALAGGAERARKAGNLIEAIVMMVLPMVELACDAGAENGRAYQRELLFGAPGQAYREQGLALIADLEDKIAARLVEEAGGRGLPDRQDAARLASESIFAVTHLVISRSSTGAHAGDDPIADLQGQIGQIIDGFFASQAAPEADAGP